MRMNEVAKPRDPEASYTSSLNYGDWWLSQKRSESEKQAEQDICPHASRSLFSPDLARYCLAKGRSGGTCTSFRIKPFDECPRSITGEKEVAEIMDPMDPEEGSGGEADPGGDL